MSVRIQSRAIDARALRQNLEDLSCGAMVWFEGRVRNHNEGLEVEQLEYEAYAPLCESLGEQIVAEARERWDFEQIFCVHRTGVLELGEVAVIVAVASHHRDEAFQAARYVIDNIKHRLPIWKREHYCNGTRHWVNCQRCSTPAVGGAEIASE